MNDVMITFGFFFSNIDYREIYLYDPVQLWPSYYNEYILDGETLHESSKIVLIKGRVLSNTTQGFSTTEFKPFEFTY